MQSFFAHESPLRQQPEQHCTSECLPRQGCADRMSGLLRFWSPSCHAWSSLILFKQATRSSLLPRALQRQWDITEMNCWATLSFRSEPCSNATYQQCAVIINQCTCLLRSFYDLARCIQVLRIPVYVMQRRRATVQLSMQLRSVLFITHQHCCVGLPQSPQRWYYTKRRHFSTTLHAEAWN